MVRQPIRVLILTDIAENAETAATFLKNGTPVVVQQNLVPRLLAEQFQGKEPPGFVTLGWFPVLDEVLKPDFDTAVPAGGPPLTKRSCRLSRTSWSDWLTSQYN